MKSIRVTKKAFKKVASIMENTMKKMIKSQLNPGTSEFRSKSGGLVKNLAISTKQDKEKGLFSFLLKFPFYGQFFDSGVMGSGKPAKNWNYKSRKRAAPNQKSFYEMGRFKGKSVGNRMDPTNMPFPLRVSVAYFGLQPKPFINAGIDEGLEQATKQLGPDLAQQVSKAIKGIKPITVG
jgi:hypothetical protein